MNGLPHPDDEGVTQGIAPLNTSGHTQVSTSSPDASPLPLADLRATDEHTLPSPTLQQMPTSMDGSSVVQQVMSPNAADAEQDVTPAGVQRLDPQGPDHSPPAPSPTFGRTPSRVPFGMASRPYVSYPWASRDRSLSPGPPLKSELNHEPQPLTTPARPDLSKSDPPGLRWRAQRQELKWYYEDSLRATPAFFHASPNDARASSIPGALGPGARSGFHCCEVDQPQEYEQQQQ